MHFYNPLWFRSWCVLVPIPAAGRYTAWICSRSLVGTAGSNPAGRMDICLMNVVLSVVSATGRSLVQRSPTEWPRARVCVISKLPTVRQHRTQKGCCATHINVEVSWYGIRQRRETLAIFYGISLALIFMPARCGHCRNILLKIPLGTLIFTKMLISCSTEYFTSLLTLLISTTSGYK